MAKANSILGVRVGRRFRRMLPASIALAVILLLAVRVWTSLRDRGVTISFEFLERASGFPLSENLIGYVPGASYGYAIIAGTANTAFVSILGIALATAIGFVAGILGRARHPLLRAVIRGYVEAMRNVPLLVLLLGLALAFRIGTPAPRNAWSLPGGAVLSNRGVVLPALEATSVGYVAMAGLAAASFALVVSIVRAWAVTGEVVPRSRAVFVSGLAAMGMAVLAYGTVELEPPVLEGFNFSGGITASPEFTALLVGLSLYTSAFIGEIVRGSLNAVKSGQKEAATALGLTPIQTLILVTFPQAIRLMLPPLTNQYLNLTKNSSLAVIVGYPDLVAVGNTVLNQTGRAVEIVGIYLVIYLSLSLLIAFATRAMERRADRVRPGA